MAFLFLWCLWYTHVLLEHFLGCRLGYLNQVVLVTVCAKFQLLILPSSGLKVPAVVGEDGGVHAYPRRGGLHAVGGQGGGHDGVDPGPG